MSEVYVIESGDYEQRMVCGVADSVEAAAAFVKAPYGPPYVVRWDELKKSSLDDSWEIVGHFTAVPGYCGTGPIEWTITRYDVQRACLCGTHLPADGASVTCPQCKRVYLVPGELKI